MSYRASSLEALCEIFEGEFLNNFYAISEWKGGKGVWEIKVLYRISETTFKACLADFAKATAYMHFKSIIVTDKTYAITTFVVTLL